MTESSIIEARKSGTRTLPEEKKSAGTLPGRLAKGLAGYKKEQKKALPGRLEEMYANAKENGGIFLRVGDETKRERGVYLNAGEVVMVEGGEVIKRETAENYKSRTGLGTDDLSKI